jgi:hypothetical protein
MRRACLLLLASCGFKGPAAKLDPDANPTTDAATDAATDTAVDAAIDAILDPTRTCWTAVPFGFDIAACATGLRDRIDITANVSLDTITGISDSPDVTCAALDTTKVCALVAQTIHLHPGVTFSARGARPLALLAHSIQIDGTLDIASHLRGQIGPGGATDLCNATAADAKGAGGGAGGTYSGDGGNGGEQGGASGTAGQHGDSTSTQFLRAGCSGGRGGDGTTTGGPRIGGGAGGGAVWIAIDAGTLIIGPAATINASGAGGLGGIAGVVRGGSGGGSGGHIVLQAPTIQLAAAARIFANGGGGGGGSQGAAAGRDGGDPTGPTTGGSGGSGGPPGAATPPGGGGTGYPDPDPDGADGESSTTLGGGGGGGGGGPGVIHVYSNTSISSPNISPPPTT